MKLLVTSLLCLVLATVRAGPGWENKVIENVRIEVPTDCKTDVQSNPGAGGAVHGMKKYSFRTHVLHRSSKHASNQSMNPTASPSNLEAQPFWVNVFSGVRRTITKSTWAEIKTACASGIGPREIAWNMGIPEGTILSRAKREGWTRDIQNAKALAKREDTPLAVSPVQAVAASMQQRGERHLDRMANIVEKTVPHVEAMEPSAILDRIDDVEKLDKIGRRTFSLSDGDSHGNTVVNIALLGIDPASVSVDQRDA